MDFDYDNVIDLEWIKLMLEAKEIGVSIKEIRNFLEENK